MLFLVIRSDITGCSLHLHADVDYNKEMQEKIKAREYRRDLNKELNPMDCISDIWERPLDRHIHVFVSGVSYLPSYVNPRSFV